MFILLKQYHEYKQDSQTSIVIIKWLSRTCSRTLSGYVVAVICHHRLWKQVFVSKCTNAYMNMYLNKWLSSTCIWFVVWFRVKVIILPITKHSLVSGGYVI